MFLSMIIHEIERKIRNDLWCLPRSRLKIDEQKRSSIEEQKTQVKIKHKKPTKPVDIIRRTSKDSGKLRRSPVQSEGDWSRWEKLSLSWLFFAWLFNFFSLLVQGVQDKKYQK